jgi:hypothetical protein
VDAGFVYEKQPSSSPDHASTQESFALLADLGPVGFRGVESRKKRDYENQAA